MREIEFGRGFGHTKAMLEGAKNYDGEVAIVAHTQVFADNLAKQCGDHVFGVGLDNTYKLRGRRMPVLIDHYALDIMIGRRDKEIEQLKRQVVDLDMKIKRALGILT